MLRKRDARLNGVRYVGLRGPERAQRPDLCCEPPAFVGQLSALFVENSLEHREEDVLQKQKKCERAAGASGEGGDFHHCHARGTGRE
jgi:hypothetical protein